MSQENEILTRDANGEHLFVKKRHLRTKKIETRTQLVVSYIVLTVLALFILLPFYVLLISSFKPGAEAMSIPFTWWPAGGKLDFSGYTEALFADKSGGGQGMSSLARGFINTMIISLPSTVCGLFISAFAAYAFAKIKFRGRNVLFYCLLITMMIPGIIMLSPSYMIYDNLYLTDTFFPLIVPGMFGSAMCVFFLRQFFMQIPDDIIEAAKMGGMNHFTIFWKIMVPLSAPALISQGILGFVAGYNDYFGPLIYLQSPENYTLQISLRFFMSTYTNNQQALYAGAVIALIPTVFIFIICQRFFVKGITMTGIK